MITKALLKSEIEAVEDKYLELVYKLLKLVQQSSEFQTILEDIADLVAIEERRAEPTISHETLLAELRQDGLI